MIADKIKEAINEYVITTGLRPSYILIDEPMWKFFEEEMKAIPYLIDDHEELHFPTFDGIPVLFKGHGLYVNSGMNKIEEICKRTSDMLESATDAIKEQSLSRAHDGE